MGQVLKVLCAIGFGIGACVGAAVWGAGMGMAGFAPVIVCGLIGAVALPAGLGILALAGAGIFLLGKHLCSPRIEAEDEYHPLPDKEPTPSKNANEQNAKLTASLKTQQPLSPKLASESPKPVQLLQKDSPVQKDIKVEHKPSFLNRLFSCFSSKKKENAPAQTESPRRRLSQSA